ncbi:uncharacterized protein [Dermacentor andersoni]|uniref:uncharacterized protein isoform X2 n=1 Tax=Dermacentor andersoni TaxID=34620 RepID=UPI0024173A4D|nr:uncharacterized protein LOC126516931 isoform X2 [Dermacentor andersoni]
MAYVIAEFVEDKQVEVVPVTWVEGDKCAWPDNLKGNRVTSLVKKSVPPDTFWKCYSVAVKGVFATYEQARAKLNDSQYTSDLGTGSEMSQGKRTRRPPAQWSDSDEPDTPPPPKKAKQSSSKQIPAPPSNFPLGLSSASSVQQDSCEESEDVNDMPQGGAGGPSSHSADGSRSHTAGGLWSHTAGGSSSHSDQRTCVPSGSPDELSNNSFKKHVLRLLNIVRFTQQHHGDLLEKLCNMYVKQPLGGTGPLIECPFRSLEDFMAFDESLDKEKTASLVREFTDLGGRNASAATKRILAYTLHDDLATLFSWVGRKGKLSFSSLKTTAAIIVAARRMTEGSTNDIEDTIKSWLRHAPERAGSHKKPSAEVCLPQE